MSSSATPLPVNNPFAGFISQIDAVSTEDLVAETRLGSGYSFSNARSLFESIKEFVEQLRPLNGVGTPTRMVGKVNTAFQQVLSTIQQIKSYTPSNYSNQNQRGLLIQELQNGYDNLVEVTVPVLLYDQLLSSGIKNTQAEMRSLLEGIDAQRDQLAGVVNESKELLAGQKKFSAEIAIGGYGTLFAKEAKEHADAAKRWLAVTSVLAALTAVAAVANYRVSVILLDEFARTPTSPVLSFPASLTVQFTIAKVILFTIGLSAAYWSARVFRSHRHNSIVNKHRANALSSFQEFVVSTTDPEVKNAVLLQTTSCIYAPQPTGFSSGNDTDGDSPLRILEIVRNLQK